MFGQEFGVNFEVAPFVERDIYELHKFSPPIGRRLLVQIGDEIAGLGGLREIGDRTGEIKRMYVRPEFLGKGLGRKLLERLIEEARQIGYRKLRLDVGHYAKPAERIYRSAGFIDIKPYSESEVPSEFHTLWQFFELSLT